MTVTNADDEVLARVRARLRSQDGVVDLGAAEPAPVTTRDAIEDAQDRVGFALPVLYVRLLTEVANGGFGPGYGIYGIPPTGFVESDLAGGDIVADYLASREMGADSEWWWPRGLLPRCNWGGGVVSYLDGLSEAGRVLTNDEGLEHGFWFYETSDSFRSLLEAWVDRRRLWDEMRDTIGLRQGIDPFTGEPRNYPVTRWRGSRAMLDDRR